MVVRPKHVAMYIYVIYHHTILRLRRRIKTHIIRYHTRNRMQTPQINVTRWCRRSCRWRTGEPVFTKVGTAATCVDTRPEKTGWRRKWRNTLSKESFKMWRFLLWPKGGLWSKTMLTTNKAIAVLKTKSITERMSELLRMGGCDWFLAMQPSRFQGTKNILRSQELGLFHHK
jgi:hypothetical protein